MHIDPPDVTIEGDGPETIVFIHGWPDTARLWDPQVEVLRTRYRCVRFTLPGFAPSGPRVACSVDEVIETIRRIIEQVSPGERVTLVLHDWGCVFGYRFATRHPEMVGRIIGVDIGDVGSRRHVAELGIAATLGSLGYQLWLATAWTIGGAAGDGMARWFARLLGAPADQRAVHSGMGYPYAVLWFKVKGGFARQRPFAPTVPMLFIHGNGKPFAFHSQAWARGIAAQPHSRVVAFTGGHWMMQEQPAEFNATVTGWLGQGDQGRRRER